MESFFTLILLFLAILFSCSTSDKQHTNSELITSDSSFASKTFDVILDELQETGPKSVKLTVLFNEDTTGMFRTIKDGLYIMRPIIWQFEGDSLRIKQLEKILSDAGKDVRKYQTIPMIFSVTKEPNGYLLQGKESKMLLTVAK